MPSRKPRHFSLHRGGGFREHRREDLSRWSRRTSSGRCADPGRFEEARSALETPGSAEVRNLLITRELIHLRSSMSLTRTYRGQHCVLYYPSALIDRLTAHGGQKIERGRLTRWNRNHRYWTLQDAGQMHLVMTLSSSEAKWDPYHRSAGMDLRHSDSGQLEVGRCGSTAR